MKSVTLNLHVPVSAQGVLQALCLGILLVGLGLGCNNQSLVGYLQGKPTVFYLSGPEHYAF